MLKNNRLKTTKLNDVRKIHEYYLNCLFLNMPELFSRAASELAKATLHEFTHIQVYLNIQ